MRPVEWIEQSKNKKVRIVLRTGRVYEGTLIEYYLNGSIFIDSLFCYESSTELGSALLNGATVAYIENI